MDHDTGLLQKLLRGALAVTAVCTISVPISWGQSVGSYCNYVAADGVWAFYYRPYSSVYETCREALFNLERSTRAPIIDSNRGYYNSDGYNEVEVSCWDNRIFEQGYGSRPLDWAFLEAQAYGDGCSFQVYRY